jgi:hypothetical protein
MFAAAAFGVSSGRFTFITHFLHDVVMPGVREAGDAAARDHVGLCASCRFADLVISSRGSTFHLCTLSATDPAFPRYPALPVRTCRGYLPEQSGGVNQ